MNLKEQLEQTKIKLESSFSQDKLKVMHHETAQLELSNFVENALNIGKTMPNFTLNNHLNNEVELYKLLQDSPVVVTFYRGSWCPYCNLALQALNNELGKIEDKAKLIAISPQTPDNSLTTQERLELKFEVLSDTENQIAKELGLVFKFSPELEDVYKNGFGLDFSSIYGSDVYELPIPATYVIGMDKEIKYAFLDVDYRKRAEPSKIVDVLKNL